MTLGEATRRLQRPRNRLDCALFTHRMRTRGGGRPEALLDTPVFCEGGEKGSGFRFSTNKALMSDVGSMHGAENSPIFSQKVSAPRLLLRPLPSSSPSLPFLTVRANASILGYKLRQINEAVGGVLHVLGICLLRCQN